MRMIQRLNTSTAPVGRLHRSRHMLYRTRCETLQTAVNAACRSSMRVSAARRPATAAPTAAPPEASLTISVAPTTVTLADGTTVTLVNPAPRQLLPQQQPGPGRVSWVGLFGALALASTALLAAAATCFLLYVRPMLQAMTATLTEMEAAARDMQQAADHVEATSQLLRAQLPSTMTAVQGAAGEVQELAGNINKAAKLLTPARLLRRSGSSSEDDASSSSGGGGKQGADGASADAATLGPSSLLEGIRELGFGLGSNSSSGLPNVLPQLQNLAAMPGGVIDFWSSYEDNETSSRVGRRSSSPAPGSTSSSSSSSVRTVWDALAVTLSSAGASKRSLVRLRSDLKAAVNVLSVLMGPAGSMLAHAAAGGSAAADKQDEQLQQQQSDRTEDVEAAATAAAAASQEIAVVAAAAAAAEESSPGPVSSMDGRIKIAAGVRLAGSAAVLRSMTEEDIESALAANGNSRNGSSGSSDASSIDAAPSALAHNTTSTSSSAFDHSSSRGSSSSSSSSSSKWGMAHHDQSSRGTDPPVKPSALGTACLLAVAAAAPPESPKALETLGTTEAATAAATAGAAAGSRSRASSPSGRRRRRSRKIEEDEWGLPSVCGAPSDSDSNSSSSEDQCVQHAAEATASSSHAVVSPPVKDRGVADRAPFEAPHVDVRFETSRFAGRLSETSRFAGRLCNTSASTEDDDEDYAGYKDTSDGETDCNSTSSHSLLGAVAGLRGHGSRGRGSVVFAGFELCQDNLLSCDGRSDDGITWSQLNQDPQLMRRVFCDNQEEVLQQSLSSSRQQQAVGWRSHSRQ